MPFHRLLLLVAAFCLVAASVYADEAHLVTVDDFIKTLGKPAPSTGTLSDKSGGSQQPRFRLRGIRAKARPPEVTINILFKSGSITVADDFSRRQMDEAGKALSSDRLKPYRFEIAGHTDSVGTDAYNQALSEKRARALKAYLVDHYKIKKDRLVTIGYGESRPVATNDTPEGRALNRRVVFKRIE